MPADLPALDRLIDDVSAAMLAAERSPRRPRRPRWLRGWPLAVTLLVLAVPSAAALRAVVSDDRRVQLPPFPSYAGSHQRPGAGPAVAISRGAVHGHPYTFIGQRCEYRGTVTIATSFAFGPDPRRAGGGFNSCVASTRRQPLIAFAGAWSAGQNWLAGLVRGQVARVDASLIRVHWQRRGQRGTTSYRVRRVFFAPTVVTRRTLALNQLAVRQGRLPRGYRLFVIYRPYATELRRVVLRDQAGRVLLSCRRIDCPRLAR